MDLLQIIFLALIQGITEFLPVSSSAHLIIPNQIWGWPDQGLAFDIAVHVGSLMAVLAYFRSDIQNFAQSGLRLLTGSKPDEHCILLFKIIIATLPLIVAGWFFKDLIETEMRLTLIIACSSIVFGAILWFAEKHNDHSSQSNITWKAVVLIGLAQTLAIIPGTSRSGVTMTAALFLKLSPETAARFSFLLSIPAILGAATLAMVDLLQADITVNWAELATGTILSGFSAFLCIHLFIKLLQRTGMTPYVIYRIALGIVLLTLV